MNWIETRKVECHSDKKTSNVGYYFIDLSPFKLKLRLNQINYSIIISYYIVSEVQEGIQKEQPVITLSLWRLPFEGCIHPKSVISAHTWFTVITRHLQWETGPSFEQQNSVAIDPNVPRRLRDNKHKPKKCVCVYLTRDINTCLLLFILIMWTICRDRWWRVAERDD